MRLPGGRSLGASDRMDRVDATVAVRHTRGMRRLLLVLPVLLIAPARVEAQSYSAAAPSSITVEVKPDGWIIHQRTVRFEAYEAIPDDIKVGVAFAPRLATITAHADGVVDDQTRTVEVTVDAMSGAGLHRVTAFSDPGSDGQVVGGLYFISTEPGCCGRPALHHVRNVETGKWLFNASGGFETGMSAWMDVPNHHPTIERWAAFEGLLVANKDPSMLGYLRYGDRNGAITTIALHMDPALQPEEFALDLPECGALLWREPGKSPGAGQPRRPAPGKCYDGGSYAPTSLFSLEHMIGRLGGFDLELSLEGKVYATIPVTDDRLDIAHAKLQSGMRLVPGG